MDSHSSGIHVTVHLKQPTREPCGSQAGLHPTPLFGLAPNGVYHATFVTKSAVRSYRTISPLPPTIANQGRFIFCCTFRWLAPPRRYLAFYPMEPGLSSTDYSAATVWLTQECYDTALIIFGKENE